MKFPRFAILAALAAVIAAPLSAMTNSDVIKMKQAELSEETILLAIAKEPANYDTSPDGLIELKKAGLSETVIQTIVKTQSGGSRAAARPDSPPPPPSEPAPHRTNFSDQDFPSIAPPFVETVAGQEYFLRSSLHFDDGEYAGTNYARGQLVPINTPVKIDTIKSNSISLHRVDTGDKLEVKNVEKYTRKSMIEVARLLFAAEQTPLDRLPTELADAIRRGELRKGMTKEQVLFTRGYPPAHETPSSESDRWVYWSSRFVKHTLVFSNNRLVDGRGID